MNFCFADNQHHNKASYNWYNSPWVQAIRSYLWSLTAHREMMTWSKKLFLLTLSASYTCTAHRTDVPEPAVHLALDKSTGFFTIRGGSYAKTATSAGPHFFTRLSNIHVAAEVCRINVAKDNSRGKVPCSA